MKINTAHQPPDDFEPSPTHWKKAIDYNVDLIFQLMRFKEHEFKKPHKDWGRAFHNWLNNHIEWKKEGETNYAKHKQSAADKRELDAAKHYQRSEGF